ncbi:MAG: fibronectin type III domain-containing protein [Bacteroidota bacterium]
MPYGKAYQIEFTTTDPALPDAAWTSAAVTSKSRVEIDNLSQGTMYWFRVKAISGNKESAYSDVALIMAA